MPSPIHSWLHICALHQKSLAEASLNSNTIIWNLWSNPLNSLSHLCNLESNFGLLLISLFALLSFMFQRALDVQTITFLSVLVHYPLLLLFRLSWCHMASADMRVTGFPQAEEAYPTILLYVYYLLYSGFWFIHTTNETFHFLLRIALTRQGFPSTFKSFSN